MKNYLFLALMSAVVFFNSCSSDDNDSTGKKLLPSKINTTYYDNPTKPETSIQTLEYDNQGQLIKVAGNGNSATFEYSNGRPIKVNYYNTKNQLEYYSDFYYTGSQLAQFKSINNGIWEPNETTTYTMEYNGSGLPVKAIGKGSDGNISVQYDYEYITK